MLAFTEFCVALEFEILRPHAFPRPDPVMRLRDSLPQPITRLLCAWPVKLERPVEQKDVGCERLQFTALSVI